MTMTNQQVSRGSLAVFAGIALCTVSISTLSAQNAKLRIIQTNSAGDNIHIIDPATNKVMGEIKGIEAPHGVAVAPDGSKIYVSEETNNTVTVFDGNSLCNASGVDLALQKYGRQIGLSSATDETLRHWERDLKPPLGPQDEAAIAHALDRCGKNRALLVKHFLGFVEFAR